MSQDDKFKYFLLNLVNGKQKKVRFTKIFTALSIVHNHTMQNQNFLHNTFKIWKNKEAPTKYKTNISSFCGQTMAKQSSLWFMNRNMN